MMSRRSLLRSCVVALPSTLIAGCAQGTLGVSPGTVLSTIVLAGEVLGSPSSSSGASRGSTRSRNIPSSGAASARAARVLGIADQYVGVPYKWGGNTPQTGFDCSGFTKYVFAKEGIALPRTSRDQVKSGRAVSLDFSDMKPGDILLFAEPGEAISHVAIYVGSGEIIQASQGYGEVNYLDLNSSRGDWYVQNLVAVRRLL